MDIHEKRRKEQQLNAMLEEAPIFVKDYFRRIIRLSINSKIQYCYDLKLFFWFLVDHIEEFRGKDVSSLTYDDLNKVTLEHIDQYIEYITYYETKVPVKNSQDTIVVQRENNEYGINRKMASLKSFFSNLYKITLSKDKNDPNKLEKNLSPLIKLHQPKIKQRHIMDYDSIEGLLKAIQNGLGEEGKLNKNQFEYIKRHTLDRDLCIISLLAETGIRISELVNINIDDIDFKGKQIKITRKGGKEEFVFYYFSEPFLKKYYEKRKQITPKKRHEKAFFLSLQKRRITTRAVQLMIDKYASIHTNKKITPHTFRRSFATNLYEETRDVYLVASLIGDTVSVATRHYTRLKEDLKREAMKNYLTGKIQLDVENEEENQDV